MRERVETGIYVVGAGLTAVVLGGLLRLMAAGLEPAGT